MVSLLRLSCWCHVIIVWLFLTMPRVCLQFVIVVFRDHTHLLFLIECVHCFAHIGLIEMCYDFGNAGLIDMFLRDFCDTYVLNMGRLGCLGITSLYDCSIFNRSHKVTNNKTFVILFLAILCLFVAFRDS